MAPCSSATADNRVWLFTTEEHHESLQCEFPNMRTRIGKVPGSRRPAMNSPGSSGPKARARRSVARVPDQGLRSWRWPQTRSGPRGDRYPQPTNPRRFSESATRSWCAERPIADGVAQVFEKQFLMERNEQFIPPM